jgi:hypothetical protein
MGDYMKVSKVLLSAIVVLFASSTLLAGEFVLYGGAQKPGKLTWSEATSVPSNLFEGQFGGTFGARFSAGRIIGFEQNISYSPRFGKPGVKAFQTDSNLLIQAHGKIVPYVTAGIGLVRTWGQELPSDLDPEQIAAFAFNLGTKFSFNYGGGIKVRRLLGPLGINVDVRGYTIPDAHDETLNIIQTSAGLAFTW